MNDPNFSQNPLKARKKPPPSKLCMSAHWLSEPMKPESMSRAKQDKTATRVTQKKKKKKKKSFDLRSESSHHC